MTPQMKQLRARMLRAVEIINQVDELEAELVKLSHAGNGAGGGGEN